MRRYTITRMPNYWEISPGISGYIRRHLAISGAVNAFPPWIHVLPRQFSHVPSLTATDLSTVRPHTFRAAAGRLSRAAAPAACRLARLSSPGRMSSRGRGYGPAGASTCQCADTGPRTGDHDFTYGTQARRATDDCFTSCARI